MQLPVVLLVAGSALALVHGVRAEEDDDCAFQGPPLHAPDCCPAVETLLSESTLEAIKTCKEQFPVHPHGPMIPGQPMPSPPPPPMDSGERPPTPPPEVIKEMSKMFTCGVECVFNETKLLDGERKIIGDAVKAALKGSVDEGLANKVDAAITHCLEEVENSSSSEEEENPEDCSSAPRKLTVCLGKQLVLNCPEPLATGPMCAEARERIVRCPNTVVVLHRHPHGVPPPPPLDDAVAADA